MATSTIPTLKAALLEQLSARPGLHGVNVTWGISTSSPGSEWIWLGDTDGEQRAAALGAQRREETYDLSVVVSVVRQGRDVQEASLRAFEIVAEIENELRADASVGNVVRTAEIDGPFRLEERYETGSNATQCEGRVILTIHCAARI